MLVKMTPIIFQIGIKLKQISPSTNRIVQELCESRWPSWAVRPYKPSGFRGRKAILNHASALVSANKKIMSTDI